MLTRGPTADATTLILSKSETFPRNQNSCCLLFMAGSKIRRPDLGSFELITWRFVALNLVSQLALKLSALRKK